MVYLQYKIVNLCSILRWNWKNIKFGKKTPVYHTSHEHERVTDRTSFMRSKVWQLHCNNLNVKYLIKLKGEENLANKQIT